MVACVLLLCAVALALYLKDQSDNAVGIFNMSDYATDKQKYGGIKADHAPLLIQQGDGKILAVWYDK